MDSRRKSPTWGLASSIEESGWSMSEQWDIVWCRFWEQLQHQKMTSLKFNLELSNEHWPNLWYRCECTSLLIIVCHNWIWWFIFSSSLFQVIYRTWSYTFMITSYTPLANNWALRIDLPFTWKYISLTLKQQRHMTQHKWTCLCKNAKIL
jgi:hypothetical protein